MHTLYTWVLLFVCLPTALQAQNPLFVPFGQTRATVQQFLQTKDYLRQQDTTLAHKLTQHVSQRQKVHYLFKEGVLYSIEDERFYDNREIADHVIKSCLDYLQMGDKKLRLVSNQGGTARYAAVEDDRLIELIIQHQGKRKERTTTIFLRATSRWHGPRMQTETLVAEIVNQ